MLAPFLLLTLIFLPLFLESSPNHKKQTVSHDTQLLVLENKNEIEEPQFTPNTRRKFLAEAFEKLADAIEANDIKTVNALFTEYPGLKDFSYQPLGTPLHFVRTKAMAEFLVEYIGISVNVCDQWGEVPSQAISLSKKERFPSKKERIAIVQFLKSHESFLRKTYNQILFNKNLHMKLSIYAMSTMLATHIVYLYWYLNQA